VYGGAWRSAYFGASLESCCRFCVCAFDRCLASLTVRVFSDLTSLVLKTSYMRFARYLKLKLSHYTPRRRLGGEEV
jgi:hypothetical protein